MIEARGLSRDFGGRSVVSSVDLEVRAGETLVLIGASGSGKTTVLKMLNRLIEPSAGEVLLAGENTRDLVPHELRRRIGYGAQRAGLFPHFDVARNIAITPRLLGWDEDRIEDRVDALLDLVQLEPGRFRSRNPASLSGGEQQRVSLARALAAEPAVVLLDEPFGALDPLTRDRLQQAFESLSAALSLATVFVTHDMSEALLLGDRIAVLEEGRIACQGTPAELLQDASNAALADLLRAPTRQARRIEALLDLAAGDGHDRGGSKP